MRKSRRRWNSGGHSKSEGPSRKIEADANQAGLAGNRCRLRSKTMNVTREVVTDLLPIYFSGDASADTRVLVEDYFRQDPDFERIARSAATPLETLRTAAPIAAGPEKEKCNLESVRWRLQWRKVLLGVSLYLTLVPLSFYSHGHIVSPMVRTAPWEAALYWSLAVFFWYIYWRVWDDVQVRWRLRSVSL